MSWKTLFFGFFLLFSLPFSPLISGTSMPLSAPIEKAMVHYMGTNGVQNMDRAWQVLEAADDKNPLVVMWRARCLFKVRMHVGIDVKEARELARKIMPQIQELAGRNHAEACFLLGSALDEGLGIPENKELAKSWYLKAISQGHALAAVNYLSLSSAEAWADDPNCRDAKVLMERGITEGNVLFMEMKGTHYYTGKYGEPDYLSAASWFALAASHGNLSAMTRLGYLYQQGEGFDKNLKLAKLWFLRAAELGNPLGKYYLGEMYFLGHGVPKDRGQALKWFHGAADHGITAAKYKLGWIYGYWEPIDYERGNAYFSECAALNEPAAIHALAIHHELGRGFQKDREKAIQLYKAAADLDFEPAVKRLAEMNVVHKTEASLENRRENAEIQWDLAFQKAREFSLDHTGIAVIVEDRPQKVMDGTTSREAEAGMGPLFSEVGMKYRVFPVAGATDTLRVTLLFRGYRGQSFSSYAQATTFIKSHIFSQLEPMLLNPSRIDALADPFFLRDQSIGETSRIHSYIETDKVIIALLFDGPSGNSASDLLKQAQQALNQYDVASFGYASDPRSNDEKQSHPQKAMISYFYEGKEFGPWPFSYLEAFPEDYGAKVRAENATKFIARLFLMDQLEKHQKSVRQKKNEAYRLEQERNRLEQERKRLLEKKDLQ